MKPAIKMAYSRGISRYIPFIEIEKHVPNKVIIMGPSFIEARRMVLNAR
jgi:hypothetical protein